MKPIARVELRDVIVPCIIWVINHLLCGMSGSPDVMAIHERASGGRPWSQLRQDCKVIFSILINRVYFS